MSSTFLLATRNAHKIDEVREILGPDYRVIGLQDGIEVPEVEETGETFEENAIIKARSAGEVYDGWVLADDSGLEVDALGCAPGVRSARYAGEHGNDGANNTLLLSNLAEFPIEQRTARFRCAIAVVRGPEVLGTFSGAVEGRILFEARGVAGFGYDPLFVPEGFEKTFAELGATEKNQLSHRARALEALKSWLREQRL